MTASIVFFPVGNGDMSLITLNDPGKTQIIIDCNIRAAADDPDAAARDVAKDLRDRLERDTHNRPFVDVFVLSHPDQDHCTGLEKHFYLGPIADYPDDELEQHKKRIVINEMWSSPLIFRRASKYHALCADARAFNTEAKRRVQVNLNQNFKSVEAGDQVLVLGEDELDKKGIRKTDKLKPILVRAGEDIPRINGVENHYVEAHLIAPREWHDVEVEEALSKNESSVILNFHLAYYPDDFTAGRFLTGGDAEVLIWERLWDNHATASEFLRYDILQAPHHCSWHSLSRGSASDGVVSQSARKALGQAQTGALIIASSKTIDDEECDPPSHRAKLEYKDILKGVSGRFYCTGEFQSAKYPEPLELMIQPHGPTVKTSTWATAAAAASTPLRAGARNG